MPPNARSFGRTIIALTIITVAVGTALAVSDDSKDKHEVYRETVTTTAATTEQSRGEEEASSVDYEDEDEGDEDNDDNEGEQDVDEYEEELRGIAESHEAMSRDDGGNSTDGVNQAEINVSLSQSQSARNFDSHEKSLEESSDESMTSNEAISSELDTEVITNPSSSGEKTRVKALSKFKRQAKLKTKREPTVKKELSSQKEIQGSETNKSTTVVSELNGESVGTRAREMVGNELLDQEDPRATAYIERRSVLEEDFSEDESLELPTQILRKVDKRQHPDFKQLQTYFPSTHIRDRGKNRRVEELGTEEHVVAESLVKLLVRLLENPRRWKQAHRLLNDVENDLDFPPLDSNKRGGYYVNRESMDMPTQMPEIEAGQASTKKPKKKKKKKKKPRYQESTTSNAIPLTPAVPTSSPTEATTERHWRLVAEHLFRPWSLQSDEKKPSNLAKIHYSVSKDQIPNHRDETSQYANEDVSMMESSRKYPLWRKFHFGKINTHEKGSPLNQHNSDPVNYETSDTLRTADQVFDYEVPEHDYHRSRVNEDYDRYGQYDERARDFDEDYQEMLPYPSEFSRSLYSKPWKYSKYDRRPVGSYFNVKSWNARYQPRQRIWQSTFEEDPDPRLYRNFGPWEEKSMRSWRPGGDMRPKYSSDKHKNRSELNEALKAKEDSSLPKISMKTWNSLTSDPATWPYKLAGAKPWPKDKDGKSYNPNADLVRKLGLDQQTRLVEKGDVSQEKPPSDKDSSQKNSNPSDGSWSSERKMWPVKMSPKIHSVGVWVVPVDQSTWKPYDPKQRQAFPNSDTPRWSERPEGAWANKLTDWNGFSKQTSHSGTWTPKWKQFSYHKVNTAPITKSGATLEGTPRTRNSFIAVSAVSPSKYSVNEWRKNDIEELSDDNINSVDKDDPTSQLLHQDVKWNHAKGYRGQNHTDSLEHQLEELELNHLEKRSPSTEATYLLYVDRKMTTTASSVSNDESTLKSIQKQLTATEESVKK